MLKRIVTACVAILVLLPFLIFSEQAPFLIPILTGVLGLVAVYEYFSCRGMLKDYWVTVPAYIMALNLPLCTLAAGDPMGYVGVMVGVFALYLVYLYTVAIFRKGEMKFDSVGSHFTMVVYICFAMASIPLLRHRVEGGGYLYLLIFFGAWVTDTFAYFVGRFLGKHKLNPQISPKKTVEGSIGGIVFCTGAFLLYGWILSSIVPVTPNYLSLGICGFICSLVSQIGDLITSLIKREHGVKDFGWLFPGHGGVLDRFDSILAVAPVLFLLCVLGGGAWLPIGL